MEPAKILIVSVLFIVRGDKISKSIREPTCGIDNSPIKVVYEGTGVIQTYPWLGTLYYPLHGKRLITAVVLISTQIVVGSAMDIDKLPKTDFRSRSRVVLGNSCSSPSIRVREYSYHPAYNRTTYSALVLIQLDTDLLKQKLHPICPPPAAWTKPQFYAITLSNACSDSTVRIHKMSHVSIAKCKLYYRKSGLDMASMWPTDTVCARTFHGRECVWKNGVALMLRQNNTWSLVPSRQPCSLVILPPEIRDSGLGVAGPGCRAPARFIDYSVTSPWAIHSIARIGRPAVTRIADNHLVMRRTTANLQRFGTCDPEEIKAELFTDRTSITPLPKIEKRRVRYNFTILSKMEYSCIVFKVENDHKEWDPRVRRPLINLRRWCTSPREICYSVRYLQIDFYVEILFTGAITYKVAAYGDEAKMLDIKKAMAYTNHKRPFPEILVTGVN